MSAKIFKATILFSIFTLAAQILGLVRDLYLTRIFGIGEVLDTYYLAFKVPDFLNIFYSVFLGSVIFIPLLIQAKHKDGQEDNKQQVQKKINIIASLVICLLILVFAVLYIFMPNISQILAPSWGIEQQILLTKLSRILLFAQFLFPVGILAGALGMVYGKPIGMALSGFFYNAGILGFSILLIPVFGIYGVAVAVLLGALCFVLIQIYPKEVRQYFWNFSFRVDFSEWKGFILKNQGRFVAVLATQIFGVMVLFIAGLSGTGGVSTFSISYNLYLAAYFILGASFSTVLMPGISERFVKGDTITQKKSLRQSLLIMFIISAFCAIILFFLSIFIVSILYSMSKLDTDQIISVASLLSILAVSLPFFNCTEVLRKYLYATNQILLTGSSTFYILFATVVGYMVLVNQFSIQTLVALCLAIDLAIITAFIGLLGILRFKRQV